MSSNFYDTDRAVAEYLLFHFAPTEEQMPWDFGPRDATDFAVRTVESTLDPQILARCRRALDLGCAVGRSAFELSRWAEEVIGIDASERFIDAARHLQTSGELAYKAALEGELTASLVARRPPGARPDRIRFEVGDALRLRPDLGTFDLVHAANLLDRVPEPARLLAGFAGLVHPGGHLVLTSPYTWLEEHTPRSEWLAREGQRATDVLADHLAGEFRRVRRLDLPFVIREHARKFQWSVAEATVWLRA
ncbi:MAG: putative 4-mercaptohistidine N1-methyltransferase [Limisphaerales bacterium]